MTHTMKSLAGAALLSLALVAHGSTSAFAAGGWSVSHGTAAASGTTRAVETGGLPAPGLAVEGELRNTGSGCFRDSFAVHRSSPR